MIRQAVESAGLAAFAEIGLLFFGVAFLLVIIRLFFFPRERADQLASLPFSGDENQ